MENTTKNRIKVLTTNDIRKHAQNWTLAGDVGLLAHLEKFSENIYSRSQDTQKCFNELVDNYEELYKKIGNVTNEFLALQNCQFVENRVYDEETPTEEKQEVKSNPDAAEQEKLLFIQYKQAVEVGVKLLDTHFQEVHLPPNSDSDEEDEGFNGNSLLWKPMNPYGNKRFPLLIGSKEWWADDNVGLGDSEENLDTERIISDESDMESMNEVKKKNESTSSSSFEDEKIIPTEPTFLESSSEDLFCLNKSDSFQNDSLDFFNKENNSLLEEPPLFSPSFESESYIQSENVKPYMKEDHVSHEDDNISSKNTANSHPYKITNAFTQELAAKLSSVTGNSVTNKSEKVPAENSEEKHISDKSLFDDTDDCSDLFSKNVKTKQVNKKGLFFDAENDDKLFSGSSDLFFDSESLFESNSVKGSHSQYNNTAKTKEGSDHSKIFEQKVSTLPVKPLSNSLFDDIDDEDFLFPSTSTSTSLKTKSANKSLPSINNNSENDQSSVSTDLETNSEKLFNSINNDVLNERICKSENEKYLDSKTSDNSRAKNEKQNSKNICEKEVAISEKEITGVKQHVTPDSQTKKYLFDNVANISLSRKHNDKAFDLLDSEDDIDDLFSSNLTEDSLFQSHKKVSSLPKVVASMNHDDASLLIDKPKQDSVSISSSQSSLFDDVSVPKSGLATVFDKDKNNKIEDDLFNDSLLCKNNFEKNEENFFATKPAIGNNGKNKNSLFDEFDDSDDLFVRSQNEDIFKDQSLFKKPKDIRMEKSKTLFVEKEKEKEEVQESKSVLNNKVTGASLFENDLGEDDLFTTSNVHSKETEILFGRSSENNEKASQEKVTKVEATNKAVLEDINSDILEKDNSNYLSEKRLFNDDIDDTELFGSKPSSDSKPKPPSTLELKNKENHSEIKSVGKLAIPDNLKAKFESVAKNISTGQVKLNEEKGVEYLDELLLPSSNLLKCLSKDRVKIPGRRRPQSRRARQEAIRDPDANFLMNTENNIPAEENLKPIKTSSCLDLTRKELEPVKTTSEPLFSSPVLSNPLSPSTDEEDYFNVPELDINFEKEDQTIFKSSLFQSSRIPIVDNSPLFDSVPVVSILSSEKDKIQPKLNVESNEDDLLFGSVKQKTKPKTINIFDDDDDDNDNLFNANSLVKSEKEMENSTKQNSLLFQATQTKNISDNKKVKEPLFGSEIDDEDLFEGMSVKSFVSDKPTETNTDKQSNEKTSQSKENDNLSFVDPLGLMSKKH